MLFTVVSASINHQSLTPALSRLESRIDVVSTMNSSALGEADGAIAGGMPASNLDDRTPGVGNLDPELLRAIRQAAKDAADDGVELYVTSGWRSTAYQKQLFDEAIARYGSEEAAARWVGTPTGSAHVSGEAVDIGHSDAQAWLSKYGDRYGLCQIYKNEPWHYELRPEAMKHGRPPMYTDASHDPRMQQ